MACAPSAPEGASHPHFGSLSPLLPFRSALDTGQMCFVWRGLLLPLLLLLLLLLLLQLCPTLHNPADGSPPGSPIPRILQARTLEWVSISFSDAWKQKVKVKSFSCVQLLVTLVRSKSPLDYISIRGLGICPPTLSLGFPLKQSHHGSSFKGLLGRFHKKKPMWTRTYVNCLAL